MGKRRGGAGRRRIQSKNDESDASDDDYKIEDDGGIEDSDEYCSSLAEEELDDDLPVDEEVRVASRLISGFPTKSRSQIGKAGKDRKVSHKEDSDGDYLHDGADDIEDAKDWRTGFPKGKRNRPKKVVKEKKASLVKYRNDDCEAENDDHKDYGEDGDDVDMWKVVPRRKRNGVQKPVRKRKPMHMEEDDECDDDDDDDDNDDDDYYDEDEERESRKSCPTRKQNGGQKLRKKKKAFSEEDDDDDDYVAEDDDCDDEDDYVEDEKDLPNDGPIKKQNGVKKALKKRMVSYSEESDDDYELEDDECDDEDEYENEEDEDEDFAEDEVDPDGEDELVVKKTRKIRQAPSQGRLLFRERKRRNNSRAISQTKRKKPTDWHGFQRKMSSSRHKEATKEKSRVQETKSRSSGPKRRRLLVDSDSDFVDEPLLVEEYSISEEEREQVQEATRFCGHLDVNLRNAPKKRSGKEGNLPQETKQKARKGKDKVEESKNDVAKQICGICLSEEGKRTVRGTLDCCSHYFCFNCIMDWSKVESRCPLCKQRFVTISKHGRSDTEVISIPERDQVYQPSEEELRAYLDPYENVICTECHHGGDDANMLLCDLCDSPAHTYCVGLTEVPEGNWYCEGCRPTALDFSIPEAPSNDLAARSSSPSENVRVAIDLNRAYEPETPLAEGSTGISLSPRAGSSMLGVGVQTVSERRRRHQMAHFSSRNGGTVGLGPEVEWGRTRRFVFQNPARLDTSALGSNFSQGLFHAGANVGLGPEVEWGRTRRFASPSATRPGTSSLHTTFPQGLLHNYASLAPNMHLLPGTPSHSGASRVPVQTFTSVGRSANGSGLLPAGLGGIRGGAGWSINRHSPMQ